jgi:hypothetical protein
VPFRKYRRLRSQFRAFNLFRGKPIGERATVEKAAAIFGSYRKERQNAVKKEEDGCASTRNLYFDGVLTFTASY